ncbi:MAG: hypothetical protein AB1941_01160 [Gemmatimonadota bacterium]
MRTPLAILLGAVGGVLLLAALRFAFVPVEKPTHYHANFALFVGGERVDLSADEYMQDVAACAVGETVLPAARAHLHNNDPDVAHVHHEGVTWGHLLTNLGFGLGEEYLALDGGPVLTEGEGRTLKFILNGQPQYSVHNELIRSGDRLLISYGPESEADVLRTQFPLVAATAEAFNQRPDPAGCSGAHEVTLWDRVQNAFGG